MNKIVFIADAFYGDFTGGAELNDFALIQRFESKGVEVERIRSNEVSIGFLKARKDIPFVVGNFVHLWPSAKDYITANSNYIIYEHDHKYLKTRNPIFYKDFIAPKKDLANYEFYKNAKTVVCLTKLAVDVFKANTALENVSKIGSSVWTDADLDFISSLSGVKKNDKYAVLDSELSTKRTRECVTFCQARGVPFDLISDPDHRMFLQKLSSYKGLAFMTGHLETCCRLVVEAKMMNCEVVTQKKLIGAASEEWFDLQGNDLINTMKEISNKSPDVFLEGFKI